MKRADFFYFIDVVFNRLARSPRRYNSLANVFSERVGRHITVAEPQNERRYIGIEIEKIDGFSDRLCKATLKINLFVVAFRVNAPPRQCDVSSSFNPRPFFIRLIFYRYHFSFYAVLPADDIRFDFRAEPFGFRHIDCKITSYRSFIQHIAPRILKNI